MSVCACLFNNPTMFYEWKLSFKLLNRVFEFLFWLAGETLETVLSVPFVVGCFIVVPLGVV